MSKAEKVELGPRVKEAYAEQWFPANQQAKLISHMAVLRAGMDPNQRADFEQGFVGLLTSKSPREADITTGLSEFLLRGSQFNVPEGQLKPSKLLTRFAQEHKVILGQSDSNINLAKQLFRRSGDLDAKYALAIIFGSRYTTMPTEQLWNKVLEPAFKLETDLQQNLEQIDRIMLKEDGGSALLGACSGKLQGVAPATILTIMRTYTDRVDAINEHIDADLLPVYAAAGVELPVWVEPQFDAATTLQIANQRYNPDTSFWTFYFQAEEQGVFNSGFNKPDAGKLVTFLQNRLARAGKNDEATRILNGLSITTKGKSLHILEQPQKEELRQTVIAVREAEAQAYGLTNMEHDFVIQTIVNLRDKGIKIPLENWVEVLKMAGNKVKNQTEINRETKLVALGCGLEALKFRGQDLSTANEFADDPTVLSQAAIIKEARLHLTHLKYNSPPDRDARSQTPFQEKKESCHKTQREAQLAMENRINALVKQ